MTLQDLRDATRHLPASTGVIILCEDGRLCPACEPSIEDRADLDSQDPVTAMLAATNFILTIRES